MKKVVLFTLFLSTTFLLIASSCGTYATKAPTGYRLLIYYGTPEGVNGVWDVDEAATYFGEYDYIVFGEGLEKSDNVHHESTVEIISKIHELNSSTLIFGYIDLDVATLNLPMSTIKDTIHQWKDMRINGIFLDDAGYDFEVPRSRLNEAIDYVHQQKMPAFINAWRPEEVMGNEYDAVYNPNMEKTLISKNDYYLLEDFLQPIDMADPESSSAYSKGFLDKMEKLLSYRKKLGVRLLSTSVIDYESYSDHVVRQFFRMNETTAGVFSLDGYSISPVDYSASEISRDVVLRFPYLKNYLQYYNSKGQFTPAYDNQDFKSRGFRMHSMEGNHFYSYPDSAEF